MPNACRGGYKGLNAIRTRPSCGRLCSVFSTFLVGTFSKLASYWLRAFARRNGLGTRLMNCNCIISIKAIHVSINTDKYRSIVNLYVVSQRTDLIRAPWPTIIRRYTREERDYYARVCKFRHSLSQACPPSVFSYLRANRMIMEVWDGPR